jgi:ATP-dependent DNA helicase HFM1/MER3
VIKSTEQWMSGQGFVEYNPISVHQMVGRAGRPQFDTFARAVIMTKMENKLKYETLLFGKQVIESKYVKLRAIVALRLTL